MEELRAYGAETGGGVSFGYNEKGKMNSITVEQSIGVNVGAGTPLSGSVSGGATSASWHISDLFKK